MSKHIHIYLPRRKTADAGWEESKHPRKDDGKFGTGSGDKKKSRLAEGKAIAEYPKSDTLERMFPENYGGKSDKKPTKAEAKAAAKAEYEAANKGKGSYAKAAKLFEAAGDEEKASGARALAKRYGHDDEGAAGKAKADLDAAADARADMKKAKNEEEKALLEELADAYEARSKDAESNELSKKISSLKDALMALAAKK